MRIQMTNPLFAWDELEDSPTLKTLKQFLEVIPDEALLESLREARGKGRDDVPLSVAWGVIVLSVALRHPTIEHCLAELRRNDIDQQMQLEAEPLDDLGHVPGLVPVFLAAATGLRQPRLFFDFLAFVFLAAGVETRGIAGGVFA